MSLVDVVIAMFLISIVAIGLISALSTTVLTTYESNQRVAALDLATSQLESIKNADYLTVTTRTYNRYTPLTPDTFTSLAITIITDPITVTSQITLPLQQNTVLISSNGRLIVQISDYKGLR